MTQQASYRLVCSLPTKQIFTKIHHQIQKNVVFSHIFIKVHAQAKFFSKMCLLSAGVTVTGKLLFMKIFSSAMQTFFNTIIWPNLPHKYDVFLPIMQHIDVPYVCLSEPQGKIYLFGVVFFDVRKLSQKI